MKNFKRLSLFFALYSLLFSFEINSLELSDNDSTSVIADLFSTFSSDYEGTTSFRSLLIPPGGRAESLGGAFTGLCNDINYISYNPAAACIQEQTEMAVFHNSWIADSSLDSIAYTTRFKDFGFGSQISCFYLPFTEYNYFGQRVHTDYYSESFVTLNAAYNFLSGYYFQGLSVGANVKFGFRSMPDYTENDTDAVIKNSGLSQSALAFAGDFGIFLRFNLFKTFSSRDANLKIGIAARNFGIALTGFTSSNGIQPDDPLPSSVNAGISYRPFKFLTISADFKQPVNFQNEYVFFSVGAGISLNITDFLTTNLGLEIKGGNPKASLGLEILLNKIILNATYTLDLTSSISPVNRISLSAKIKLGDRGRKVFQNEVDSLYNLGLEKYNAGKWQEAIDIWQNLLDEKDKNFDPAKTGIKSAKNQIKMFEEVEKYLQSLEIE